MTGTVVDAEKLHPLTEAVFLATGQKPCKKTVRGWCTRPGKTGIKLESKFIGGQRFCSVEAVIRWTNAVTASREGK